MATDLSFPLALWKAQWCIWLHTLEMLQTLSVHALEGQAAYPSAVHPSAAPPTRAPDAHPAPMSRRVEVQEALHTLHDALAAKPARRRGRAASVSGRVRTPRAGA